MIFYGKRVLFLGAHPDDIELGAGALIHNIRGQSEILCATLSDNQKNPALQNVVVEHRASMAVLGVPEDHDLIETFETRKFPDLRQEVLEYLLKLRREFQPEIIFCHSQNDIHQDHNVVTQEALRAYRGLTLLGFDVVRSSYNFFPHFLVEVNEARRGEKDRGPVAVQDLPRQVLLRPDAVTRHDDPARDVGRAGFRGRVRYFADCGEVRDCC